MTDWYVSLPYATGMISVYDGRVANAPPIWRWMIGMHWADARRWLIDRGGHGEPMP